MSPRVKQKNEAGHTLLIVLLLMGFLTLGMGVYLNLTSTENKIVMRSECWNSALGLAEAGIEEGLSQIVVNSNNFSADGWTKQGTNNVFVKSRTNGLDYYSVSLSGTFGDSAPCMLNSTGMVHWDGTNYISRGVQVQIQTKKPFLPIGLVANTIDFGGTTMVDSYDTSNPLYCNSNNVAWYDATRAQDDAFVATPGLVFQLGGTARIEGSVAVGTNGIFNISGNAKVGDSTWNSKGIQTSHGSNGFAYTFPPVDLPYSPSVSTTAPTTNSVNGTNYTYVLNQSNGKYYATNLTATTYGNGGAGTMYVSGTNCTLIVKSDVNLDSITFAPGASLNLFLDGDTLNFVKNVYGAPPTALWVYGTTNCTTLTMTAHASFVGVVCAPWANLDAEGGGDFYGAMCANSFKCRGNYGMHYDAAAGRTISVKPVTIQSWSEL